MTRTVPFGERHGPSDPKSRESLDVQQAAFQGGIVAPDGRPARTPKTAQCPQCGADPDQRVPSAGFGTPLDVCQACGHEFKE
jgi:rubredoxin